MEAMMKTTNAKTTADTKVSASPKRLNGYTGGPAPGHEAPEKAVKKGTIHSAPVGGKLPLADPDDAPFTDVLELVPALSEAVRDLTGDPKINAIMAGIEPILKDALGSTDLNDVEFSGQQVIALLQLLEEELPAAANDVPQFTAVQHRIARIRSLVAAYLPPADAAIAAPGLSSQAGKASNEDTEQSDRTYLALQSVWEIEALARMVLDELPDDDLPKALVLRSMLRRVIRLACLQMDVVGDDHADVASLTARFGESAEAAAA
jgi:hypothetical protein